jgi:hypothetical protein
LSRSAGVGGLIVLRADSAYYGADVIAAARRAGGRFSITARKDPAITAAIASIGNDVWTTIRYPRAVFDQQLHQWVSDAEVAKVPRVHLETQGPAGLGAIDRAPRSESEPEARSGERAA